MRHMFISVWIDRFKKNKIKLVKIMPDGNNWNLMEIIRWSCPLAYIAKSISNPSIPPLSGLRQQAKSREAILKSTNSTMSSPPAVLWVTYHGDHKQKLWQGTTPGRAKHPLKACLTSCQKYGHSFHSGFRKTTWLVAMALYPILLQ